MRGGAAIGGPCCYGGAAVGGPCYYRRCAEVLPSVVLAATVGARRCCHQRSAVLASARSGAIIGGWRCYRRCVEVLLSAACAATVDARRCYQRSSSAPYHAKIFFFFCYNCLYFCSILSVNLHYKKKCFATFFSAIFHHKFIGGPRRNIFCYDAEI